MAGSSPVVLLPSAGRWRSPISAAAVLPADLSVFMSDRGDPPGGPGVVAGTTDGVAAGMVAGRVTASGAGTAVAAGTRPGWAEAATDIGAEEISYVELITCTRRRSGGLAGALHRASAIGSSAPTDTRPSNCRTGSGAIDPARAFRRNSSRDRSADQDVAIAARHYRDADTPVDCLCPGDAR